MKQITTLFCLLLIFPSLQAQVIRGKITDKQGAEVPFAKIRVENTGYGTVANAVGAYQLELKKGRYVLIFSAFGYQNYVDTVQIKELYTDLSVVLEEPLQQLEEVVVLSQNKKERGKEIMKEAIDKRSYFYDLLSEYRCDTYCFGALEKDKLDSINKDSIIGREKLNLIEWRAFTSYKKTAKFKDEFYAYNDFTDPYKELGTVSVGISYDGSEPDLAQEGGLETNPYLFVTGIKDAHFSIFDNAIDAPKLTQNPLISPLAFNAFFYYNFYLENSFLDNNGNFVYEISVKPKFSYEALFEGTIFIRDKSWEVVSYDLGINPQVLLFFKDIRIICDYEKVGERLVPKRKEFVYDIKEGKTVINGLIRLTHQDYVFEVPDDKPKYWQETAVFTDDAFDKDASYWDSKRPFTLKDIEKKFMHEQDSIITYHESDEYLRRMDSIRNDFRWWSIFVGTIGHVNSFKKYEFYVGSLVQQVVPFGVGGYRHKLPVTFKKEFKNGYKLSLSPEIDYGFLNKDLKGAFTGSIMYNPRNFATLGIVVGDVYDFVTNNLNISQSLLPVSNRVRNQKFEVNYRQEISNGLYGKITFHYSDRQSIENMKYPAWWDSLMLFFAPPQPFERYKIFLTTVDLEYHFKQKYMIRKNRKIVFGSPWPTLYFQYKKAIPGVFDSEATFDRVEFRVHDEIKLNSFGNSELKLVTGSYLHKKDLRLIEYKFFRQSDQIFFSDPTNTMQSLDTFLMTNNSYLQFNFIHHFNGFFLNKVWLINKLKLEETIGGGFLTIPDAHFSQVEFFAGLERKFRIKKTIFKLGYYACLQGNTFDKSAIQFKFGINFYDSFLDKWNY
ncbi:MAG: DUF5686 and carboxypeptidase regulatory-like domain-containing protein [Bacteroidota bacterium]